MQRKTLHGIVFYCVVVENEDENDVNFICEALYEITSLMSIISIEI
jgi:hypothetical protein